MNRVFAVDAYGIYNLFVVAGMVVAAGTTVFKIRRADRQRRVATWTYVAWGEVLFYAVGLGLTLGGLTLWVFSHLAGARGSVVLETIGLCEIGVAIVALIALWRGFEFRLASTLGFLFVSVGLALDATPAHQRMPYLGYLPLVLAIVLVALAFASRSAYERNVRW